MPAGARRVVRFLSRGQAETRLPRGTRRRRDHPCGVIRACHDARHSSSVSPGQARLQRYLEAMSVTAPADPFAVLRTKQYVALLFLAAVLGVVISFLVYWYLKLIAAAPRLGRCGLAEPCRFF